MNLHPSAEEMAVTAHRLPCVVVIVHHTRHLQDRDMLAPAHLRLSRGTEMMDTTNGGEMILEIDVGHHLHPGGAIGIGMNPLI